MLFNFILKKVEVYISLLFCTKVNFCLLFLVIAKQPFIIFFLSNWSVFLIPAVGLSILRNFLRQSSSSGIKVCSCLKITCQYVC